MLLKIFTLGFEPATERFNDEPVRDFLADKEVISIDNHFFQRDGTPYLTLVICYRFVAVPPAPAQPHGQPDARRRDDSWRDLLDASEWPLFNRLRDWRSQRAKAEGLPPYVICNNRQLAEVVKRRPATLTALAELDGFGDAKLKKYGKELIEILAHSGEEPKGTSPEGGHAES